MDTSIISTFQMARNNAAHIGSAPLVGSAGLQSIKEGAAKTEKTGKSFEDYLLEAVDYVNDKQQASSDMAEKLIVDPDSVDVHDVTIAMAEAQLSLSIAQTVIDRITSAWNEITTTR